MFELYSASPVYARAVNVVLLACQFMAWVGCIVSFDLTLLTVKFAPFGQERTLHVYFNKVIDTNGGESDSALSALVPGSHCTRSGDAMVGFLAPAFLALLLSQVLLLSRIVGFNLPYFSARGPRYTVFCELVVHVGIVGAYFLAVVIYGGGCTRPLTRAEGVSVMFDGFAYIIGCLLLVILSIVLLYRVVLRDVQCHLGPLGTSSGSSLSAGGSSSSDSYGGDGSGGGGGTGDTDTMYTYASSTSNSSTSNSSTSNSSPGSDANASTGLSNGRATSYGSYQA